MILAVDIVRVPLLIVKSPATFIVLAPLDAKK